MYWESKWNFALINSRLAEVYYEKSGSQLRITGWCYPSQSTKWSKREKAWIDSDTKKNRFTLRNRVFRNQITGKITPA